MGMGGADWLVRAEREREEAPERALDVIGLAKGDVVADIGAGAGYFTGRMAERGGPGGKGFASDIQPRMVELLGKNGAARGIKNVVSVLAGGGRHRLSAGETGRSQLG